jgi:hypothetical protein
MLLKRTGPVNAQNGNGVESAVAEFLSQQREDRGCERNRHDHHADFQKLPS